MIKKFKFRATLAMPQQRKNKEFAKKLNVVRRHNKIVSLETAVKFDNFYNKNF